MIAPARWAALQVLRRVGRGDLDAGHALERARAGLSDRRDRALLTEIALGTLRWRARLDHAIGQVSSRPLARIDPEVHELLRMSSYQLLHLSGPAHAVVDDAVALARATGRRYAAPFVNGVLRALARQSSTLSFPAQPRSTASDPDHDAALDYLSITMSHPRWLVERWLARVGFDAAHAWTRFDNEPPSTTLRVDTRRVDLDEAVERLRRDEVETTPGCVSPHALRVTRGDPQASTLFREGLAWIQDEASQLVAELVTPTEGARVLDCCAAPGGKTRIIASAMGERGLLVAGDLRRNRTRLLATTLRQCGSGITHIVRLDARHPPSGAAFDWVVLDAPCSGLGTLRRDPDIRWRRSPQDLVTFGVRQTELLHGAATAVKPGGRLLYATCSGEPEENREPVRRFLAESPAFSLTSPSPTHVASLVDEEGYFDTRPDRDGLDAFFAAVLVREIP